MINSISYWSMKDGLANRHLIEAALADAEQAGFAVLASEAQKSLRIG